MGENNNSKKYVGTLFRDNSEESLKLEEKLIKLGYDLKVILSGSPKPVFSYAGGFLSGYCEIERFVDR